MSADVNANLDGKLDRMLCSEPIAKRRVIGGAATGPYPLRLREQLGEALKPRVDAFRVDQNDPP